MTALHLSAVLGLALLTSASAGAQAGNEWPAYGGDLAATKFSTLADNRFDSEYPEAVNGMRFQTGRFLLHLCTHAAFHLGQAGYLRRAITGQSQSSGPIPLKPVAL